MPETPHWNNVQPIGHCNKKPALTFHGDGAIYFGILFLNWLFTTATPGAATR